MQYNAITISKSDRVTYADDAATFKIFEYFDLYCSSIDLKVCFTVPAKLKKRYIEFIMRNYILFYKGKGKFGNILFGKTCLLLPRNSGLKKDRLNNSCQALFFSAYILIHVQTPQTIPAAWRMSENCRGRPLPPLPPFPSSRQSRLTPCPPPPPARANLKGGWGGWGAGRLATEIRYLLRLHAKHTRCGVGDCTYRERERPHSQWAVGRVQTRALCWARCCCALRG